MKGRRNRTVAARLAAAAALGAAAACAPGCNIAAPVFFLVHGPPKVPAVYELDSERPTVIFIDDRGNTIPRRSLRNVIVQEAEALILEQGVIDKEKLIAGRAAMQISLIERHGELKSIDQIGQSVGAEVVIYVKMLEWKLSQDGSAVSPSAKALVKIIDATDGSRIYPPADTDGHPLTVAAPKTAQTAPETTAEINELHVGLAHLTGRQLARMFFTHERDGFEGSLSGQY